VERGEAALDRPSIGGIHGDGQTTVVTVSGRTKTEAKAKLREVLRDHEDGLPTARRPTRSPRQSRTGSLTGWDCRNRAPW
jgi:hypothetical protein